MKYHFFANGLRFLLLLVATFSVGAARADVFCYSQSDWNCASEYGGIVGEEGNCNAQKCSAEHVVENGQNVVVNNVYQMIYTCPPNKHEPVATSDPFYTCEEGTEAYDGETIVKDTESTVNCIKLRYCKSSCTETTEVESGGTQPYTYIARCDSNSGGALVICTNEYEGCALYSTTCSGAECPDPPTGE